MSDGVMVCSLVEAPTQTNISYVSVMAPSFAPGPRLVRFQARWDLERAQAVSMTPMTERARSGTQDAIEEADEPHDPISPPVQGGDPGAPRRVKIMPADLVKYGYSDRCPTCTQHRLGDPGRDRSVFC